MMNKHKQGTAANAPPADQIFIYITYNVTNLRKQNELNIL